MALKIIKAAFSGVKGAKIVDAVVRVVIMFVVKEALLAAKNSIKKYKKKRKKKKGRRLDRIKQ